jgi:hypothetical protein
MHIRLSKKERKKDTYSNIKMLVNKNSNRQNRKLLLKVTYYLRKIVITHQHRKSLHNKKFIYKQQGTNH